MRYPTIVAWLLALGRHRSETRFFVPVRYPADDVVRYPADDVDCMEADDLEKP